MNKELETPFDPSELPAVFWSEVFLRCNNTTLLQVESTCRFFHSLLSDPQFWMKKCEYDGVALPPLAWRQFLRTDDIDMYPCNSDQNVDVSHTFDYKSICLKNPFNHNLAYTLTKDSTLEQLENQYGVRFEHGGNGFQLERVPQFAAEDPRVDACLATSYGWCHRFFEIDLVKAGIDPWILDNVRPVITVREMNICRRDCAALYELQVQLLCESEMFDRNVILPRFKKYTKSWPQWQGGLQWETTEFTLTEYPRGVRRVAVLTSGKDEQFWEGYYGSKFANTEVVVSFPSEVKLRDREEFADPPKQFAGGLQHPLRSLRVPVGLRGRMVARRNH